MKQLASWCLNLFIAFNARYPTFKPTVMRLFRISHNTELKVIRFAMKHGLIGNLDDSARLHKLKRSGDAQQGLQRNITDVDYFELKLLDKISSSYGPDVDFSVIYDIRRAQKLSYSQYADNIETAVSYIYLALLFRYPSSREVQHCKKQAQRIESFDALFQAIPKLPEYSIRGYKGVEE